MKTDAKTRTAVLRRAAAQRSQLRFAVAVLALLAVALTAWFVVQDRRQAERQALADTTVYARVLEDQVTRSLTAVAGTMRSLSARGTLRRSNQETEPASRLLEQQLVGQPLLRSLAVLDGKGRILASTVDGEVGLHVDADALGLSRTPTPVETIGAPLPIRELGELARRAPAGDVTAMPMVRPVPMEKGQPPLWLVALLNPDHFATQHAAITASSNVKATVTDLRGRPIASNAFDAGLPQELSALAPFVGFLPERESGAYIGSGSNGEMAVGAFRLSRLWPLVVLAEQPLALVLAEAKVNQRNAVGVCAAFLAMLAALGWVADRGLRREEQTLQREAKLQDELAQSEERWKLALEGAGHGVWDIDLRSGRASLSRLLIETLGPQPEGESWTLRQLREAIHPDDRPPTASALARHRRGEIAQFTEELRVRAFDGRWRWLNASGRFIRGDDGSPTLARLVGTVTDITARKTAELALRESEARQQAILRSALDGIVSVDAEGRIIGFNPAAEAIFGRVAAEVLGRPMHEVIMPHRHREAHTAGMERYLRTGHGPVLNRRIEVEGLRADGEVFPLEIAITPVATADGETFTATVRDITGRQRIERALRETRALLNKVGQIASVGGWQVVLADQSVRWTDQTFRLHDLEPGRPPPLDEAINFYTPASRPLVQAAVARTLETGEPFDVEAELVTARGRSIWVRSQGAVETEGGIATRVIGTVQDITARRAVEAALRESEARFRSAFEQAAVGMLEQDREGRVLRVNPALSRMLGLEAEALVARPVRDLLHPDDFAAAGPEVQAIFDGELDRFAAERRFRHRDGHYVWGRYTASAMRGDDGHAERMLAIIEDISARREVEAALAESRQRELSFGARIQQALLAPAPGSSLQGLWLSSLSQASQGIDGDFVDIISLGEGMVDLVVGDVMGKGIAAAMLGAATKMQFGRSRAELLARTMRGARLPTPAEIVAEVHAAMSPKLQELEAFVTLSYVRLDTASGAITWVGCGHEEPLLLRPGETAQPLGNQHPPLGVLDEVSYEQYTLPFGEGDALFLASDGAVDALLPDGSRLGRERLASALRRLVGQVSTPAAVLHVLRHEILSAGATIADDLTMALVVHAGAADRTGRSELRGGLADVPQVRHLVEPHALAAGLGEVAASLFTVACVEAYTNAVRHTQDGLDGAPVEVAVRSGRGRLVVEIVCPGAPYEVERPADETDFAGFPEGGFGLSIMRDSTDAIEHLHAAGVNTVRLTRFIDLA